MSFTVPNVNDSGIYQDQAEPDKGDFQSLGYRKSGVLSGGASTKNGDLRVDVTAVSGYLNGEYFDITSAASLTTVAPISDDKFVLIVVSKSGSTFSITQVNGTDASNAVFPDFDSSTQLLLASVYYKNAPSYITGIVDKRVFIMPQANPTEVASLGTGAPGEVRVLTGSTPATGQSTIYVNTTADGWTNLAKYSTQTIQNPYVGATTDFRVTNQGVAINNSSGTSGHALYASGTGYFTGAVTASSFIGNVSGTSANWDNSMTLTVKNGASTVASVSFDGSANKDIDLSGLIPTTTSLPSNWPTARTISLSGVVTGSASGVDGSGNVNIVTSSINGYLPTSGGTLSGSLVTQNITPSADVNATVGYATKRYLHGYFQLLHANTVYASNPVVVSSDLSLKEDIKESPGLSFVNKLKPLSYRFKNSPEKQRWGFGAQDVEAICPPDAGVISKEEGQDMGLSYTEFIAPMVKALQEITERLEAIENG